MIVILTEKPSAARNFAKALGGSSGTYNGEKYLIVSARGHLLAYSTDLTKQVPEELADKYKKWQMENLPWEYKDFKWIKAVLKGCSPVLKEIKEAAASASEMVIATDVDPSGEGEVIAWEILSYIRWNGRTSRMYFTDETEDNIRKAFRERKQLPAKKEQDGDYVKAVTRSKWDFLSMQFTRIASLAARTKGYNMILRQGRLKSVMVYMVGRQLEDIQNYTKKPFYEVRFKDENGIVFSVKDNDDRFDSPDVIELGKFYNSDVVTRSATEKSTAPGKLLDLAALSSILAEKGYTAKTVLDTYQKMYEDHIVSYPRTEDKTITSEQFNELLPLADKIADVVGVDKSLLTHRQARKTHVKDEGAHGANRPGTKVPKSLEELSAKYGAAAADIYETVARNFLAILAEDYIYTHYKAYVLDYPEYKAIANVPKAMGYKAVYDADAAMAEEKENADTDKPGRLAVPFIYEGSNKKPQTPTMKWLTKKLEKYNVGTGATRTQTISDITSKASKAEPLMSESKGKLKLSEAGEISYVLLMGSSIADVRRTEELFNAMEEIGKFNIKPADVLNDVKNIVEHDKKVMWLNAAKLKEASGNKEAAICSCLCGSGGIYKRAGKYGAYYSCDKCHFKLNETVAGKKISESQIKNLMTKGSTDKIKGFTSSKGKTFDAKLTLKTDLSGVAFKFK